MATATNDPARAVPAMTTLFNQPSAKLPLGDSVGVAVGGEPEPDVGGAGGEAMLGEGEGVVVGGVEGEVEEGEGVGDGVETVVGEGAGDEVGGEDGAGDGTGVDGGDDGAGEVAGGVGVGVGDAPGACAMHEVANKASIITTLNPVEVIFIFSRERKLQRQRKRGRQREREQEVKMGGEDERPKYENIKRGAEVEGLRNQRY